MTVESLPIETLCADPANARVHSARNVEAIKASLVRFGQQKPIVVDARGIVRAGNGTLEAAKALGWKQIQAVRSDLIGSDMIAYAIADNRTSDLSEWDDEALARQLDGLRADGMDLGEIGFDDFRGLDPGATGLTPGESPGAYGDDDQRWLVIVTCKDEGDQVAFLEQMELQGRTCKAVIA